ncbi:MAG: SDR family NAD(P)-dependent oxidoreductase [Spirochaetia bacterium]|jgi:short-subunit dehydrogenase|nr:SDR family NAD(P)-dependent oxidoreductase [Spirochaetia bacterium]
MINNTIHVVITGGSRGIGLGLTTNFLKQNCDVTISGVNETRLENTLTKLQNDFPNRKISGFTSDITNRLEVEKLCDMASNAIGPIDIWVNNAGKGQNMEYSWDLDIDTYTDIISTNVTGLMHGSLAVMNRMIKQGYGKIFNMEGFGSNGMIRPKMAVYGTTKKAVRYFTKALSKEAENTNVLIGTISPGMVVTDFIIKPLQNLSQEEQEKTIKIFNILADRVETVTPFLVERMLKTKKNGSRIEWLTNFKIFRRFLKSPFTKRDLFTNYGSTNV